LRYSLPAPEKILPLLSSYAGVALINAEFNTDSILCKEKMMQEVPSFIDRNSPDGIHVYQLTDDPQSAGLVYPDQPSFLADGRRLLVNTSTGPVICDPDDGGTQRPIFSDEERRHLALTFDGQYAYYPQQSKDEGSLTISRIDLDSLRVEDVFHAEGLLPGTSIRADRFGISTVSSDHYRVACGLWLGDGNTPDAPYGIVVLDLENGETRIVAEDRDFCNPHLQYCRSTDPVATHDLLVQMNHGVHTDAEGKLLVALGPPPEKGTDIHAVRDDGTNWRDLPFGRDGHESCIGHQIWRGFGTSAVTVTLQNEDTSYGWADGSAQEVVAGWPMATDKNAPHIGLLNPGARRMVLTEGFVKPRFCHLADDASGLKFVFDTFPIYDGRYAGMHVYIGSAPDEETPFTFRYILNSGVTFTGNKGHMHAHPIISPDGRRLFFNSDITGKPQAYMVTDFTF